MSERAITLAVPGSQHGQSLHEFLVRRMGLSGRKAKALLDDRQVFVNGRRVWMARHPLAAGDRVEVIRPAAPERAARDEGIPVLWEDDDYVIVNKPVGLLAEGRDGVEGRAAAQGRLWAVHRLDRDTTGCLLLTRRPEGRDAMIPVFVARTVDKLYHAIVAGRFPPHLSRIDEPLEGQPAVTHIRLMQRGPHASLLEVRIETGRTHQIRKHLAGAGHPVAGDREYAGGGETIAELRAVPRQLLHASRLAFPHPRDGHRVSAEAPWPEDFRTWCRTLGLSQRAAPPRP